MSDSEDDFMSDKYLVEAPAVTATYTAKRARQQLHNHRAGQAKNLLSKKEEEARRRREGLGTSLFERERGAEASSSATGSSSSGTQGGASSSKSPKGSKAMEMMMKMGWSVGEGLGRRRSASPERDGGGPAARERGRVEPIRVSMWAGRKGLSARTPSPPPLLRDTDALPAARLAALDASTTDYRAVRGHEFEARELAKKASAARARLVDFDADKGVKYHPLHAVPGDPLALPQPLLHLLYPVHFDAPPASAPGLSRSPSPLPLPALSGLPMSTADKVRQQMRAELLAATSDAGDIDALEASAQREKEDAQRAEDEWSGVDWEGMVSGVKGVLAMSMEEDLKYLVSQLRAEHLYCPWCALKYRSWEEMVGPDGCPGEDEDDH
ncbi:hypothetical protein Q5752_000229 [Cryptotrichosporon argae]